MLCQYCGKHPVTTHVKTIVDGELTEYLLCAGCAQKLGYGSLLTGLGLSFGGALGELFGSRENGFDTVRCGCCGASFEEIARSGKVGCAECYSTFRDRLMPLIQQIHGGTRHRGKVPGKELPLPRPEGQLAVMRSRLREAIGSEDFEQAAALRDSIHRLEAEADGGEAHGQMV